MPRAQNTTLLRKKEEDYDLHQNDIFHYIVILMNAGICFPSITKIPIYTRIAEAKDMQIWYVLFS